MMTEVLSIWDWQLWKLLSLCCLDHGRSSSNPAPVVWFTRRDFKTNCRTVLNVSTDPKDTNSVQKEKRVKRTKQRFKNM